MSLHNSFIVNLVIWLRFAFFVVYDLFRGFVGRILKLICTCSVRKVSLHLVYVSLGAIILDTPFSLAKSVTHSYTE